MKRVSIQDLKARLSSVIADVEAGVTVVVTRHQVPVAVLSAAGAPHVHRGSRANTGRIRPAVHRGTNGRYLAVLLEDRGNR